ncbi:HutD family protein [Streptomyces sp. R302]|uniref:HutD/Ves family protein n=1 Tax=unclassified Streptomyces TaxID=2593676 RepID=UPI00145F73C1|nr:MULTISPECIES: HutD family protein [unclassified Streptomyces]NML50978.1 HutD family protein [Streptomyces sp. R301]NML81072.1 HutD family protein [Streptomyces sp. R302]
MHRFDVESLAAGRWRNGGGVTREIVSWPEGAADFEWRASVADIEADGPFSAFPGVDRTFTLLEGGGVRLTAPGGFDRTARPEEPLAFPGDLELTAELAAAPPGGACRVLNLMVRRGRRTVRVERVTGAVAPPAGHAGVLLVRRGHWRVGGEEPPASAGQGVWWGEAEGAGGEVVPLSSDAVALWADLAPGSGY